jgi:predicted MFS family arabinose efflux permease
LATLAPVAIGPVIGGLLAGSLGWTSVFWFLSIYAGVFLLLLVLLLPETLRSIVGNGSHRPMSVVTRYPLILYQTSKQQLKGSAESELQPKKSVDVTGPTRILFSKQALPIIAFLAVYYAVWQMSITAMSSLFQDRYGLSETAIGLTFIANGVGSIIGTLSTGKILDADYRKVREAHEAQSVGREFDSETMDFSLEKARLRLVPVFALIQCGSILVFGWTINFPQHVHIAAPIASTFVTGWTAVSMQSVVMTYLVDVFSDRSAAASASLNLARCLFAAGGTSFVMLMVNGIGVGLSFTTCVIAQVVALLGVAVQWRFGGEWRGTALESTQHQVEERGVRA